MSEKELRGNITLIKTCLSLSEPSRGTICVCEGTYKSVLTVIIVTTDVELLDFKK